METAIRTPERVEEEAAIAPAASGPGWSQRILTVGALLLIAVGVVLRLYGLGTHPTGLYHDEAWYGLDALQVIGGTYPLFFPGNNGREPFFIYLVALTIKLFGQNPLGVRAAAALCGLVRSAQLEHPDRMHLLDLDTAAAEQALTAAVAAGHPQAALREGTLLLPDLHPVDGATREPEPLSHGTVLVTGATGALGGLVARHLVTTHGARHLLLASRRGTVVALGRASKINPELDEFNTGYRESGSPQAASPRYRDGAGRAFAPGAVARLPARQRSARTLTTRIG